MQCEGHKCTSKVTIPSTPELDPVNENLASQKKSELLNEAKRFKTTTAIIFTGLIGTEQI